MPHTDGPMFYPIISTISCGSHTILEFYKNNSIKDNIDGNEENSTNETTSLPLTTTKIDKTLNDPKTTSNNSNHNNLKVNDNNDEICYDNCNESRKVVCKLLIEPRSLVIIKDSMYKDYLHAISEKTEDIICDLVCNLENCENSYKYGDKIKRDKRISLTIRHVPKTTKLKLNFLKK